MFEKLEEEIEVKADEYALEESTACNYGESSKHVYKGYFYGFKKGAEFGYNKAYGKLNEVKKCLGDIVYMTENNLHTKNELAFARIIAKAKDLLKKE